MFGFTNIFAKPHETIAAVDLGSNSFHMIVARVEDGQLRIIDRLREMVRLGAGLDENCQRQYSMHFRSTAPSRHSGSACCYVLRCSRGHGTHGVRPYIHILSNVRPDPNGVLMAQVQTTAAAQRSADFQVEVARYELQAAKTVLEYTAADRGEPAERLPVVSPVTGRVLKVVRECEGPVRTGDMLLEVGDPTVLEVEVDVLSADAVKIKPGMKVLFDRWGGEQPLEGIVRIVEPVGFTKISALGVEEQRVLIISDFTSPAEQWQRVGDGYRVEARFILWHQDDVLQIPASSLFRYQQGWAVFVVENHHAKRQVVTVGQRNGLVAQILEGVSEGEAVVNHPSDDVEDGRRVKQRF